jgi:hypothetical protein
MSLSRVWEEIYCTVEMMGGNLVRSSGKLHVHGIIFPSFSSSPGYTRHSGKEEEEEEEGQEGLRSGTATLTSPTAIYLPILSDPSDSFHLFSSRAVTSSGTDDRLL